MSGLPDGTKCSPFAFGLAAGGEKNALYDPSRNGDTPSVRRRSYLCEVLLGKADPQVGVLALGGRFRFATGFHGRSVSQESHKTKQRYLSKAIDTRALSGYNDARKYKKELPAF